jgi:drug/metabolite transporter (DMT)-like permease
LLLIVAASSTAWQEFSLFLNQGTALVYIVWSVVLLLVRREPFTGGTRLPILVAIGLLNGSGNFFTAISQPHTPGLSQTLLGLLNIPLVLLLAWLFLGRKPSIVAVLSAALIVGGTAFSSLRTVLLSSGDAQPIVVFGWAITLFGVAQLFLAGEKVFEERVFRDSAHVVRPMQSDLRRRRRHHA